MTLIVEERKFTHAPEVTGQLLKLGHTNNEALTFFTSFKEPTQQGWIEVDYGAHPHIRSHADGLGAVLTNARVTPNDYQWFVDLLGQQATNLITRHHNIY